MKGFFIKYIVKGHLLDQSVGTLNIKEGRRWSKTTWGSKIVLQSHVCEDRPYSTKSGVTAHKKQTIPALLDLQSNPTC